MGDLLCFAVLTADRCLPKLIAEKGDDFASGKWYDKNEEKFRRIFDPNSDFVFTEEDAKEMFINSSESDYVWLPLRFEGDNVRIDWLDEWKIEDYK